MVLRACLTRVIHPPPPSTYTLCVTLPALNVAQHPELTPQHALSPLRKALKWHLAWCVLVVDK